MGRDAMEGDEMEGDVWASIYGFDSVLDGPGRFALDRVASCARSAPISTPKHPKINA